MWVPQKPQECPVDFQVSHIQFSQKPCRGSTAERNRQSSEFRACIPRTAGQLRAWCPTSADGSTSFSHIPVISEVTLWLAQDTQTPGPPSRGTEEYGTRLRITKWVRSCAHYATSSQQRPEPSSCWEAKADTPIQRNSQASPKCCRSSRTRPVPSRHS